MRVLLVVTLLWQKDAAKSSQLLHLKVKLWYFTELLQNISLLNESIPFPPTPFGQYGNIQSFIPRLNSPTFAGLPLVFHNNSHLKD